LRNVLKRSQAKFAVEKSLLVEIHFSQKLP
jgi:hypothetical protein